MRLHSPDGVYVGRVEGVHGLAGLVVVRGFLFPGNALFPSGTVLLTADRRPLPVVSCRPYRRGLMLLGLNGVSDREEALRLRDQSLYIDEADCADGGLPIPLYAMVGMEVRGADGSKAVVTSLEYNTSNPLLLVKGDGGEFALPVRLVLHEGRVDWRRSLVEIDLPEGLEEVWHGRA
ncbi:hypothetical protein GF402_10255 [Candidatus Fermentibacteria bacterium]|nr:hypothetical protein [Candidatus Fermentibacteria bacterium]